MTLRAKIVAYFVAVHLVLAGAAAMVLFERSWLLFAVEALFVISIVISYRLIRALFVPLELLRTGAELISERDFGSRFTPVGHREMDELIAVYNDMIDRLREERIAAEEQHQLLEKIVEASPSGIIICNFDGAIEQQNPAGRRLLPDFALIRDIAPGESRLITINGTRRLKVWRAEFRDRGFPKSFYLIEEMTEELRLSEKAAYEKLIRMMSHEVNNSVGSVRSLLDSIRRYSEDSDFTHAVTVASSRMDALNRFMRDLAEIVRIPPPFRSEFAMADLVRDIASLVKPELDRRGIALTLDVHACAIYGDRAQLEQVVLNVVRNAMDATPDGGAIAIRCVDRSVVVEDSGAGIPDDIRGEIFSPFFSTRREGRGLGLTIVQEILTNHGFGFSLENRAEGGARFRISW